MNHKMLGIFGKVFFYTVLISVFVIIIAAIFFAGQITAVFETTQRQQIMDVFEPLIAELNGKSDNEKINIAKRFHEKNASFEFCIEATDGRILFKTEKFEFAEPGDPISPDRILIKGKLIQKKQLQYAANLTNDVKVYMRGVSSGSGIYKDVMYKSIMAILMLFIASVISAFIFAKRIADPIKKIASDTKKMSEMEFVPAPAGRRDEIGQLEGDVYKMYRKLQLTIQQLEKEIENEKQMEENQRYFFSMASHELKTPVAATSALLEGMLENVIEVSEYPHYLRECLKMTTEQSKLITEILEIVKLSDDRVTGEKESANLKRIILDTLPTYQMLADTKKQEINVEVPDNLFCTININLFSRVLSNLIMNAIQNTPEQGEIRIFTEEMKVNKIRLCILNTNVRIENEDLPKLFEPFYREDKARSRNQGRSGLGLTIVKKALDIMKIGFSLENVDDGVLFWMDLPC